MCQRISRWCQNSGLLKHMFSLYANSLQFSDKAVMYYQVVPQLWWMSGFLCSVWSVDASRKKGKIACLFFSSICVCLFNFVHAQHHAIYLFFIMFSTCFCVVCYSLQYSYLVQPTHSNSSRDSCVFPHTIFCPGFKTHQWGAVFFSL